MRIRNDGKSITFNNYEDFGKTVIMVDCIGPLVDISKINEFSDIKNVRYLTEHEISEIMNSLKSDSEWNEELVIKTTNNAIKHQKLSYQLIDAGMLIQLCRAKTFCTLKLISTVNNEELFVNVKKALINYSKQLIRYQLENSDKYLPLEDNDFFHNKLEDPDTSGVYEYCKEHENNNYYKIGIDDYPISIRFSDEDVSSLFQEWISGQDESPVERLKKVLDKREHIADGISALNSIINNNPTNFILSNYMIMKNYYVYSKELYNQLDTRIKAIESIIKNGESKTKPICVFLSGTPGTGKSFFVKCFASRMNTSEPYPVTSLSGVASDNFYVAIENHIEQVYNLKKSNEQTAVVAFLDEIDTKTNDDHFAFRFLMDAMTGSRTDNIGIAMDKFKSGSIEDLVWFFAGSAGATRQEFIDKLIGEEKKVVDFFDRIHFDMQLPSPNDPGQAVLTLMSGIQMYWKDKLPKKISIKVLLAFACTKWNSTRSIMTICRVASVNNLESGKMTLDVFEGIDTSYEFYKNCNFIIQNIEDEKYININWD